jgi:acylphosphatase
MPVRARSIAHGDVQRLGYRDAVEYAARKLNLTGFVENLKPYDLRIVVEGEQTLIESLIDQIRIKGFPIMVEELDVKFEAATGEFTYFEIKRGDMAVELGE